MLPDCKRLRYAERRKLIGAEIAKALGGGIIASQGENAGPRATGRKTGEALGDANIVKYDEISTKQATTRAGRKIGRLMP